MKQWLLIFALVWAAATVNAAGENHSISRPIEIQTSVLSQASDNDHMVDNAPLLATPCPGSSQLIGTEQGSRKNARQSENLMPAPPRSYAYINGLRPLFTVAQRSDIYVPNVRNTDRYIYYLRRIVI